MGGAGRVPVTDVLKTPPERRSPRWMLADAARPLPTFYAGALRSAPRRPTRPCPTTRGRTARLLFALEASADGRLQWHRAVGLRNRPGTDEHGQSLAPLPVSFKPPAPPARAAASSSTRPARPARRGGPARRPPAAVRLKQGDKPAKRLKE